MTDLPAYFDMPGAPGKYFRCEPYGTAMSVASCSGMFKAEKGRQNGRHPHCGGCPVGALHAGEAAPASSLFGAMLCPRCRNSASRIVRELCVSCVNRDYERAKGRNAKGSPPVHLRPVFQIAISWAPAGAALLQTSTFPRVVDRLEATLRVLRSQPVEVAFAWSAALPVLPQLTLFG